MAGPRSQFPDVAVVGVPMIAGGRVIGVLHVGSLTPRRFTSEDVELLQLAADRAAAAVQSITAQADRAAVVALQRSLVPSALPAVPGAELAARYVPGRGAVGGDWYDVFTLPGGQVCVTVGDVAGSGLAAAVIMGRIRSALRAYALETTDPAEVLRRLDCGPADPRDNRPRRRYPPLRQPGGSPRGDVAWRGGIARPLA